MAWTQDLQWSRRALYHKTTQPSPIPGQICVLSSLFHSDQYLPFTCFYIVVLVNFYKLPMKRWWGSILLTICWYGKRFSMYLWKKTDWRLAGCVWHTESFKWGHSQKWTGQNTFLQANKTMNRWSHEQNQNFYTHRSNACSGTDSREVKGTK